MKESLKYEALQKEALADPEAFERTMAMSGGYSQIYGAVEANMDIHYMETLADALEVAEEEEKETPMKGEDPVKEKKSLEKTPVKRKKPE
jgi:hypothetical protein